MKKVLAWIKSNLLVVIFSAIIVTVVPASYFVSSAWNNSIRDQRQKAVDADYKALDVKVNYVVPMLDPGEAPYEFRGPPNAATTAAFAEIKKSQEAQAGGVVKAAEAFNSRDHREADGTIRVLVPGLLPNSSGPAFQSLAGRMVWLLVGSDSQPSVYKKLFDDIGAGEPAPGAELAQSLVDARQREVDQIIGGQAGRALTPDEEAKVTKALVDRRKAYLQSYARRYSLYGTPAALAGFVPTAAIKETVPIRRCFQWQADFWLVEDLLAAVKAANTSPDGGVLSIAEAVVKRIEKITPRPSALGDGGGGEISGGGGGGKGGAEGEAPATETTAASAPSPTAQVAPDFTRSITGRWGGSGNAVYDVRKVDMQVVVSSKNLPKLIDAISRTNFMTVIDCDLYDVDVWADLDQGFYYGEESVVRAKIEIETVWLRSWTTVMMPKEIRAALGIPEPEPAAEGEKKKDGPG